MPYKNPKKRRPWEELALRPKHDDASSNNPMVDITAMTANEQSIQAQLASYQEGINALGADIQTLQFQVNHANERSRLAEERWRLAEERSRFTDERSRVAEERSRLASERTKIAEERRVQENEWLKAQLANQYEELIKLRRQVDKLNNAKVEKIDEKEELTDGNDGDVKMGGNGEKDEDAEEELLKEFMKEEQEFLE